MIVRAHHEESQYNI